MSKKGNKARSEIMKMLALKDDKYLDKLKKRRGDEKTTEDFKGKSKPKETKKRDMFIEELKEVGPELVHGVKQEFKKIKSMFTKDKKDK